MSHSWEKLPFPWVTITSFTPWVTHGIELRAFIACKMPKSRHNVPGKVLHHLPQRDIPEI